MPDAHTLVWASGTGLTLVSLALSVLVLGHAVRHRRSWPGLLAPAAVVAVLLGFAGVLPQSTWFVTFPLLLAVFPDGRPVPRWTVLPVALAAVATAGELGSGGAWSEHPLWPVFAVGQLPLLLAQVHRYRRRATTQERQAVRWVILGTLLTVVAFQVVAAVWGAIGEGPTGAVVGADLAQLPLAVSLAVATVRPQLLDVDQALHATITACLAAAVLVLLHAAVALLLPDPAPVVAVGAGAVPAFLGARAAADWVVYRGRPSADAAVDRMLTRLGEHAAGEPVPGIVLAAAMEAVHLDAGTVSGTWFTSLGEAGEVAGPDFPILFRGEELAVLSLPPRRGESSLTARDRRVIEQLVIHAAPAMHGARTLADLQESRRRLVVAREEERRLLRRDLHDDLGPALAGLSLSAAALARRTGLPEANELHHDIQATAVRSREIAHGLRPAELDDRGLVAAIVERTTAQDELLVTVTASTLPDLPAAVDVAALRIVAEAVHNTRRHAHASQVTVHLECTGRQLEVVVEDDGRGLPGDARPGLGMRSIAERAAEVGGTARFDRTAPGTRLLVTLPLDVP